MLLIRNTVILDDELTLVKLVAQNLPVVSPLLQTNDYQAHYDVSCEFGWLRNKERRVVFPTLKSRANTAIEE